MTKELSEMTLEELWQLFPIFLVAPKEKEWEANYLEMEKELKKLLKERSITRISHIGSTAIKGIWAKDIVDVMVELDTSENMAETAALLQKSGFRIMSAEPARISLNKGYTPAGFADKVYHIHLRSAGDNSEIYFRDYLNDRPEIANEYEQLKLSLWKRFEHDRNGYTEAKSEFIAKWTREAKKAYEGRW